MAQPGETTYTTEETSARDKLVPQYWVIMHNDPVTTMDFVVSILMRVLGHDIKTAVNLMLSIHHGGMERVALMPLERAEFKVEAIHTSARAHGFPLTCTIEPD